jgi:hypothetical protein
LRPNVQLPNGVGGEVAGAEVRVGHWRGGGCTCARCRRPRETCRRTRCNRAPSAEEGCASGSTPCPKKSQGRLGMCALNSRSATPLHVGDDGISTATVNHCATTIRVVQKLIGGRGRQPAGATGGKRTRPPPIYGSRVATYQSPVSRAGTPQVALPDVAMHLTSVDPTTIYEVRFHVRAVLKQACTLTRMVGGVA